MSSLGVILPAAGRSTRFGGERNKLLELLHGRPVVAHAAEAFLCRPDVAALVIVTTDPRTIAQALPQPLDRRIVFCMGGASRAESVRNGLGAIDSGIEWVAVHDAARPLLSQVLIDRTWQAAQEHGAAVPAMPIQLTVKQASGPLPAPVQRTIPRNTLWGMQTPQIMRRAALAEAFARCPVPLESITDDVQLLEILGQPVWLVAGEERNLKITTELDLQLAELILRRT